MNQRGSLPRGGTRGQGKESSNRRPDPTTPSGTVRLGRRLIEQLRDRLCGGRFFDRHASLEIDRLTVIVDQQQAEIESLREAQDGGAA